MAGQLVRICACATLLACGSSASGERSPQDGSVSDAAAPIEDAGLDTGEPQTQPQPGEVVWTVNGESYTEVVPSEFDVIDVASSGKAATAALQTDLNKPEWVLLATTVRKGLVPAGTYSCAVAGVTFATHVKGSTYQSNPTDGGSCAITVSEDAANKGVFRGTFTAMAKNESVGGPDAEVTGAFNLPDSI